MQDNVGKIRQKALELGFSEIGICSAGHPGEAGWLLQTWLAKNFHGSMAWMARTASERADPRRYFPEAQSVIVTAHNYYRENEPLLRPGHEGNISIYARGRDYHKVVRKKLKRLLEYVQMLNPGARGRVCVDSFPLMEKPLAVKAGLGWIGKHTNLIIKKKGSYFFLGEILLSVELPCDEPFTTDFCGACNRCQTACPTNALEQPFVLDARRCISYLTIEHEGEIDPALKAGMENWVFGCDICQVVCPWNRFSEQTAEEDFHNHLPVEWSDLQKMQEMTEQEFVDLFAGTPVRRTGFKNFMRNVRNAVENRKEAAGNRQ